MIGLSPLEAQSIAHLRSIALAAISDPRSDYDAHQTSAWLLNFPGPDDFHERIFSQKIVVALDGASAEAVGFMALRPDGLIDFAFIHPDHQGAGHFRDMVEEVEIQGRNLELATLEARASRNALGPFLACGFELISRELVELEAAELERFHVRKSLNTRSKEQP
ncbi:GNAT family N-acetyltransferase [Qipengyuania sphaerica]|uniref:GNAT family N-acetyltransferase n=1 Tax=Qipengyuania sphaerica TaxID=2867243 RepID=UPI001C896065|nr:GNAT family N-acetyltransferase [Qipengyuania sphaerica]MBX7541997.1 GNAT family N-acetyltransferase [Qipengyuania sphaerica]